MRFTKITGKAKDYIKVNGFSIDDVNTKIETEILYVEYNGAIYHVPTIRAELYPLLFPYINDIKNKKTWKDIFEARTIKDLLDEGKDQVEIIRVDVQGQRDGVLIYKRNRVNNINTNLFNRIVRKARIVLPTQYMDFITKEVGGGGLINDKKKEKIIADTIKHYSEDKETISNMLDEVITDWDGDSWINFYWEVSFVYDNMYMVYGKVNIKKEVTGLLISKIKDEDGVKIERNIRTI